MLNSLFDTGLGSVTEKGAVLGALPVTLTEVKEHIGLVAADTSRDAELTAILEAAIAGVEAAAEITVRTTSFVLSLPEFAPHMLLEKRPYAALTKIEYVQEGTGEILTVASSFYHVQMRRQRLAMIVLGNDQAWPADAAERFDAVRISYLAGFADGQVPLEIKTAILMTVAKLDANRGDCGCGDGGDRSVFAMKNRRPTMLPEAAALLLGPWVYQRISIA